MKTLFVGHFLEKSGVGHAARLNIKALQSLGHEVCARPIVVSNDPMKDEELPAYILEAEAVNPDGAAFCIQHVLPHLMVKDYRLPCVAYFANETTIKGISEWIDNLNCMDEIWVPSAKSQWQLKESGVKREIHVVHHYVEMERFAKSIEPLDYIVELQDKFVFYFVGEFVKRKNLEALLKAFHTEFDVDEPVELLIKTNVHPDIIKEVSNKVKIQLKLKKKYKGEVIISERLTEEQLLRVHASGHCFVMPSCGEACCLPFLDAQAIGNPTIITRGTGMSHYDLQSIDYGEVESIEESCFGAMDTFAQLYSSEDQWQVINIKSLQVSLRRAFDTKDRNLRPLVQQFSMENTAEEMSGRIDKWVKQ